MSKYPKSTVGILHKKLRRTEVGVGGQGSCERKMKKKSLGGGGVVGGCEGRIEVIVKMQNQKKSGGSGRGQVGGGGGQVGCERRSEVIVKYKKNRGVGRIRLGWSGWMRM